MSEKLRHGFKAEAERIALSVREELDLPVNARLDALVLAKHFEIPVISLRDLLQCGAPISSVNQLIRSGAEFSALTVCSGTSRLIVYNPSHPRGRRANSLAHELSHVILEHPSSPALDESGCRRWDAVLEAEADWLAGALLVPREGALLWMMKHNSVTSGAAHFGVSQQLFSWRVNQTGVSRQLIFIGNGRAKARAYPRFSRS
jgi:hypothetical protein